MGMSTNVKFRSRDRRYKQLSINENPTQKAGTATSTVLEGDLSATARRLRLEQLPSTAAAIAKVLNNNKSLGTAKDNHQQRPYPIMSTS